MLYLYLLVLNVTSIYICKKSPRSKIKPLKLIFIKIIISVYICLIVFKPQFTILLFSWRISVKDQLCCSTKFKFTSKQSQLFFKSLNIQTTIHGRLLMIFFFCFIRNFLYIIVYICLKGIIFNYQFISQFILIN